MSTSDNTVPEEQFRQGIALRQSQDANASVTHFTRLAAQYPDHLRVLLELSISQRLRGHYSESVETAQKILAIDRTNRPALLARLDSLIQQRDLVAARDAADAFLMEHPEDWVALLKKATVLRLTGDLASAMAHLKASLENHPDFAPMLIELSVCLRLAGEHRESLSLLDRVLAAEPRSRSALLARIDTCMHARNFSAAADAARLARDLLPADGEAILRHVKALRLSGRAMDARHEINGALLAANMTTPAADTERRLRLELSHCLLEMLDLRGAVEVIDRTLNDFPNDQDVLLQALSCARHSLNTTKALDVCERALKIWPGDSSFEREKIALLIAAGDLTAARHALDVSQVPHEDLRIRWFIHMRRFDEAKACLVAMGTMGNAASNLLDRLEAQILDAEGRTKAALGKLVALHQRDRDNPNVAALLVSMMAKMGEPEQAIDLVLGLTPGIASKPVLQRAYAHALGITGDVEQSTAIVVREARNSLLIVDAVKRLVAAAGKWGFGSTESQHIMSKLDQLLADVAGQLPDFTVGVLRLHRAFGISDWDAALELSQHLCAASPKDYTLSAIMARAAMETGDLGGAIVIVATILARSPAMPVAISMREALFFGQGHIEAGLSFLLDKLERGDLALSLRVANIFLFMRRGDDLRPIIKRNVARVGEDIPHWLLDLQNLIDGRPREKLVSRSPYPSYTPLTQQELTGLMAWETDRRADPLHPSIEAAVAWSLQETPGLNRDLWIKRAIRATHVFQTVVRRGAVDGCGLPIEQTESFSALQARLREHEPTLLVSTHCGVPFSITLTPHLPNLTYVIDSAPTNRSMLERHDCIPVSGGLAAAQLIKKLRSGRGVLTTPDFPIEQKLSPSVDCESTGTLFNVTCRLVDTVPKISQALRVPVYWVQPRLVGKKIVPDVRKMYEASPDESELSWLSRWTQEYLDLLADLLKSEPENQNLSSPMNRYLALMRNGYF